MADEQALVISELTNRLLSGAEQAISAAKDRRDLVLTATLAAAGIPEAQVLRVEPRGAEIVMVYTVPNGGPPAAGGGP